MTLQFDMLDGTTSRPAWIACAGATRDAAAGRIRCPQGGMVAVSDCLDCHLLETLEDESVWPGCSIPDG